MTDIGADRTVLVTGAAGFIGFHVARRLLDEGRTVVGLDSLNAYYDPALKYARLDILLQRPAFTFVEANLTDRTATAATFARHKFERVIHLAAQAGVRHSIDHPHDYVDANLDGFVNVLEGCRRNGCGHLIYASSSSVYGANAKVPFAIGDTTDQPISLYAATKKANELMAHCYSHLYQLPTTGLRLFTVYGPWGRPDMAYFIFTKAILAGEPIKLFNYGDMRRDFTYIDDVTTAVSRLVDHMPQSDEFSGGNAARIYNVGNRRPEQLTHLVAVLEQILGRNAIRDLQPMQPGDVIETFAEIGDLMRDVEFRPDTPIEHGLQMFVSWYRSYYKI